MGSYVAVDSHHLIEQQGGDALKGKFVLTRSEGGYNEKGLTSERAAAVIERLLYPLSRTLEVGYVYGMEEKGHHDWCMCVPPGHRFLARRRSSVRGRT